MRMGRIGHGEGRIGPPPLSRKPAAGSEFPRNKKLDFCIFFSGELFWFHYLKDPRQQTSLFFSEGKSYFHACFEWQFYLFGLIPNWIRSCFYRLNVSILRYDHKQHHQTVFIFSLPILHILPILPPYGQFTPWWANSPLWNIWKETLIISEVYYPCSLHY